MSKKNAWCIALASIVVGYLNPASAYNHDLSFAKRCNGSAIGYVAPNTQGARPCHHNDGNADGTHECNCREENCNRVCDRCANSCPHVCYDPPVNTVNLPSASSFCGAFIQTDGDGGASNPSAKAFSHDYSEASSVLVANGRIDIVFDHADASKLVDRFEFALGNLQPGVNAQIKVFYLGDGVGTILNQSPGNGTFAYSIRGNESRIRKITVSAANNGHWIVLDNLKFQFCSGCLMSTASGPATCVRPGVANPANNCQACQPNISTTAYTNVPNGTVCEDGNFCTGNDALQDTCSAGTCTAGGATNCDDGLACTADTCVASVGCLNQLAGDKCLISGACMADGEQPVDSCMYCDPAVNRYVLSRRNAGQSCDDGNQCTIGDSCDASGNCDSGPPKQCENVPSQCASSACAPATGECSTTISSGCLIDGACYEVDYTEGCRMCTAESPNAWTFLPEATDCSNACFTGGTCNSTGQCIGTAVNCDDGLACTTDSCSISGGGCINAITSGCVINGKCIAPGATNPENGCEMCIGENARQAWTPKSAGTLCSDGSQCTMDDTCNEAGVCVPGALRTCESNFSCAAPRCDKDKGCVNEPNGNGCFVDGTCVPDGAKNPYNGCEKCDAAANPGSWTPVAQGTTCTSGKFCDVNSVCNGEGTCVGEMKNCDDNLGCTIDGCSEERKGCYNDLAAGCLIDGECHSSGATSPGNACKICTPGSSRNAWTLAATNAVCGVSSCTAGTLTPAPKCNATGECVPTAGETCSGGVCLSTTTCDGKCNGDEQCVGDYHCNVNSQACVKDSVAGAACQRDQQCGSGYCVDGTCCNTRCDEVCESCNLSSSRGTCTKFEVGTNPQGDCKGTFVCSQRGECVEPNLPNGEPCTASQVCASGHCADGVCCNSACDGECASCNSEGRSGECTPYALDTDPEDECDLSCNGAGNCVGGRLAGGGSNCSTTGVQLLSVLAALAFVYTTLRRTVRRQQP